MYQRGPAAKRIAQARRRSGKSTSEAASRLHLTLAAYDDLETYDDEAFTTISLSTLCQLGELVGVPAYTLVALTSPPPAEPNAVPPSLVASRLEAQLQEQDESVESASQRLGWDISALLSNPTDLWATCNVDCLQDLCRSVDLNWLGVLAAWPGERAD